MTWNNLLITIPAFSIVRVQGLYYKWDIITTIADIARWKRDQVYYYTEDLLA